MTEQGRATSEEELQFEQLITKHGGATTREQAQGLAQEYQQWASEQSLSYGELAEFTSYFETLAEKFGLTEEFKENGII